ncbi:hypothetical protein WR25_12044 [Diploscapter pachys]|uniref:Gcp-like domain-containing protein n=1 Tax=Diploscapter pachys TaxID=2018661 RepID=A0A2A2LMA4_9BILA|nr:hypothetical protein WR25_12044 [Diploscapter pachys]
MHFHDLKGRLYHKIRDEKDQPDWNLPDFCAGLLWMITAHIASKLHLCLEFLMKNPNPSIKPPTSIVVAGGVASNSFIFNGISKLAREFSLPTIRVPPKLCTDNAEMIAWTGLLSAKFGGPIHRYPDIPESVYVHDKYPIGDDIRHLLPNRPKLKLSQKSLFLSKRPYFVDREEFRRIARENQKLSAEN